MRKRLRLIGALAVAVAVLVSVGFYAWTRAARYPAFPEAVALAERARTDRGWFAFEPDGEPIAGFIFYPGGLVDPAAYAPLMRRLSEGGVLAVIVEMPLDLAVFGQGRADDVVAAYPGIDTWVIGGHSLGGAMAAEYMKDGPEPIDGVVFLAAYPADSTDLTAQSAAFLSIYGSEDGVADEVFEKSLERLPEGASLEVLEGGNHAQFGDYGPQRGDGAATMSRREQQRLTADAILGFVKRIE